jgi:hypothetical protein
MVAQNLGDLRTIAEYIATPELLPGESTALWFVLNSIRLHVRDRRLPPTTPDAVNRFLLALPAEHRLALFVGLVNEWSVLGVDPALLATLKQVTGL